MKFLRFVLGVMLSLYAGFVMAQDVLVLRNGEEMQVVVTEVTNFEVKYKKFSNQNGPLFTIPKNEVFMLKYKNGEKDVFGNMQPAQPAYQSNKKSLTPVNVGQGRTLGVTRKSPSGLRYLPDNTFLTEQEAMNYLGKDYYEFQVQSVRMKKGFNTMLTGAIFSVAGSTLFIIGMSHTDEAWYGGTFYGMESDPIVPLVVIGGALMTTSCVLLPVGTVKFVTGKTRCHRMVKQLNGIADLNANEDCLKLDFGFTGNGLGVRLNF